MNFDKYSKIRINSWIRKISQATNNHEWKKNRNLHAICLLDMIINGRVEEPYSRLPPEGPLPILSKTLVKSKLTPKFWRNSKNIYKASSPYNNISPMKNIENLLKNYLYFNKNIKNSNLNYENKKKIPNNKYAIINQKNKRAKTPTIKKTNFRNLNNSNYKINNNSNKNISYVNNNIFNKTFNNKNFRNNIIRNKNNIKNIKKCNTFKNYSKDSFNYIDYNLNNNNFNNILSSSQNINYDNNDLDYLRKTVLNLQEELNQKELIIGRQRDERVSLTQKVDELEKKFKYLSSINKL